MIRSPALDRRRARELAAQSVSSEGYALVAAGPRFGRGEWRLEIPELHEGLADDADWNAVTWSFEEGVPERLARTIDWAYEALPGELTFEALWDEDPIEEYVDRDELLRIIRSGRVGTRVRYRVRAS